MSKGVLIFAFNNEKVNYETIAHLNALMIEYNMNVPVHIFTSHEAAVAGYTDQIAVGSRRYKDFNETLSFNNGLRWNAFELSPYDETLILDADYLIMNDRFNAVWGSRNELMINTDIVPLFENEFIENKRVDEIGITMAWATAIYFRKTKLSKYFFSIMKHVFENYLYYRHLYNLSGGLYRNDYAASISLHMLNGFNEGVSDILPLPVNKIVTAKPEDRIIEFSTINKVKVLITKPEKPNEFIVNSIKNTNVHFLNKKTILENHDNIVKLYQ